MFPSMAFDRVAPPAVVYALQRLAWGVMLVMSAALSSVHAETSTAARLKAARYAFEELVIPDAGDVRATSINNQGDVIGVATPESGSSHPVPFIYHDGQYTLFEVPGADATEPRSINGNGAVVGYFAADDDTHGFLYLAGTITTFDAPNANITYPVQINAHQEIAGTFQDRSSYSWHGFIYRDGKFTVIDWPGARSTRVHSINDRGQVAGNYQLDFGYEHGFTKGKVCASFDCPSDDPTLLVTVNINNRRRVMGYCMRFGRPSELFVYRGGRFRTFALDGAAEFSAAAMNDRGHITGHYTKRILGRSHGFLFRRGRFFRVDVPGARSTVPNDINASAWITGYYTDSSGHQHGFLAKPQ